MLVRVMAVQSVMGQELTLEQKLHIIKRRPDFVCLPEYCLIDRNTPDFSRAALKAKENLQKLKQLSLELATCLIAGSVVETDSDFLYNSSYLMNNGENLGRYRKLNPVSGEIDRGIMPGDSLFITMVDDVRIAMLICADALNINLFEVLSGQDVDIVFIPTTSPLRPAESKTEKIRRDRDIYIRASQVAGAYIVKTCGVGTLFGKPLQGRSLIATPWGIPARVQTYDESETAMLSTVLDIDEIREFRKKKRLMSPSKVSLTIKKGAPKSALKLSDPMAGY